MIQSSITPDQDTTWESNEITINHHTQDSQGVSPFPAGDHKATANRQETWQTRNTNNKNDPQKKYRFGTVSKKHLTGGLKRASQRQPQVCQVH